MNRRNLFTIAGACLMAAQGVSAESLGTYGRTYPIKERDAIAAMKDAASKKLANGGKERMLKDAQTRYMNSLENVATPAGIKPARSNAVRFVDLTETITNDIPDGRGGVIARAGMKINPLGVMPLTKKLFFIDARDQRQLELVKTQAQSNDKIILLGGSVFKAGAYLKRHVYLDVPGLHTRMQIKHLPSIVSQDGLKLKVQEVAK
jgi:conjugal transfer pilus assembly protein TraW